MIKEWRASWGQGDIPFLFVQLPRFETKTRYWNELREAQYLTSLHVKNTGMAVAFDQGNPKDIHPIVKDTVGWRLAQMALGKVYGKKIVYQGPEFRKKTKTRDGSLLLEFANAGTGIIVKDGSSSLSGFMVAGKDGQFYPAEAVIVDNNRVRVKSNQVNDPVDVRYLWVNSGYINFFNKEGFPALPFRTDKYRLETEGVCVNPEPMIPQLDLFLFIGQSNMAGRGYITDNYKGSIKDVYLLTPNGDMEPARNPLNKYSTIRKQIDLQGVGPAYSFAKAIADKTKHKLGLVVNARGGSSINSWLKGAKDDYYGEALSRIRQAMKYGTLKAIIWHQGEADSRNPEAYMAKLQKLVADLREDLGDTKLPVIVGEIAEWRVNGTSDAFNKMLRTVPRHIPYSYCVSSRELVPLINENDPHFSADSQIILGIQQIQVPASSVPAGTEFGIYVSGDSMEPRYHDGQIVWVKRCEELECGDIGIFVYDDCGYLKKYDEHTPDKSQAEFLTDSYGVVHNQPVLVSLNTKYSPILISPEQRFEIVGKVLN